MEQKLNDQHSAQVVERALGVKMVRAGNGDMTPDMRQTGYALDSGSPYR
jgi:hypothetical protein